LGKLIKIIKEIKEAHFAIYSIALLAFYQRILGLGWIYVGIALVCIASNDMAS